MLKRLSVVKASLGVMVVPLREHVLHVDVALLQVLHRREVEEVGRPVHLVIELLRVR